MCANCVNLGLTLLLLIAEVSAGKVNDLDYRIIGGVEAQQNAVQHQVSIRLVDREKTVLGSGFKCGGSLISANIVLSAGHCMFRGEDPSIQHQPEELILVMGSLLLNVASNTTVYRNVSRIIVHENYTSDYVNDIAILIFNESVIFNDAIQPIRLAEKSVENLTNCTVSGWGSTEYNIYGAQPSNVLLSATVPIVSLADCMSSFGNYIQPGMICAGHFIEGGVDACQGDSGGPLVCNDELTGIVSFGNGCAFPFFPGVYADVSYFRNWILKNNCNSIKTSWLVLVVLYILYTIW